VDRPELTRCLDRLDGGDTLVVWRLDRLGRSLADLLEIVTTLQQRKVAFVSLKEKFDTSHAAGRLIFHVFASLAEFERELIRERTMAGLSAAKARGRCGWSEAEALKPYII
jgi:DNA invertase Pin-like site-specific DNA recombinase